MRDGKKEWKKKLTLDWHWLIENSVCSRNESWLVWLISFHLIDWLMNRISKLPTLNQTNKQTTNHTKETNKQSRSKKQTTLLSFIHLINWLVDLRIDFDLWVSWESVIWLIVSWLIDWQKRYIEDGWVGKEKFDWFNDDERNQWKKEWIRFIWFWFDLIWLSHWIDWDEWESFECFVIVLLLVWFDLYFEEDGNWNKQANDNEKDCWLICLLSQSIEIHHHHQTWLIEWLNEWKIELISTSKTNQASIQVADYWNKKQSNKQINNSLSVMISWFDWLIGNWKKVRHKNEIDFISLFTWLISGWFVSDWLILIDLVMIFKSHFFFLSLSLSFTLNQRLIVWSEMKSTINCERLMEIESKQHQLVGSFIHLIDWLSTYSDLTLLIVTLIYLFFISFVSFFLIDWSNFDWLIWKLREMKERKRNELKCIWHWLNQIR